MSATLHVPLKQVGGGWRHLVSAVSKDRTLTQPQQACCACPSKSNFNLKKKKKAAVSATQPVVFVTAALADSHNQHLQTSIPTDKEVKLLDTTEHLFSTHASRLPQG